MNHRLTRMFLPLIAAALFGLVLAFELISADEDDKDDSPVQTETSPTVGEARARQDNLFALINQSFQTVKPILEKSCYDCHSSSTHYPWYAKLPLIKGFIASHIKEGREHVDFSNGFPFSGKENILEILKDMHSDIDEGEMPLCAYRVVHWGTGIDGTRKDTVFTWIDSAVSQIKGFYDREKIPYKR